MASSGGKFKLTNVLVLSGVVVKILSSIVVITPNGNFWIVPLLHSGSDMANFNDSSVSVIRLEAKTILHEGHVANSHTTNRQLTVRKFITI